MHAIAIHIITRWTTDAALSAVLDNSSATAATAAATAGEQAAELLPWLQAEPAWATSMQEACERSTMRTAQHVHCMTACTVMHLTTFARTPCSLQPRRHTCVDDPSVTLGGGHALAGSAASRYLQKYGAAAGARLQAMLKDEPG